MNTVKRALIKIALVGTLAGGMVGMPLVASASSENANPNACHGVFISGVTTIYGGLGKNAQTSTQSVQDAQQQLKHLCKLGLIFP